jgi:hypothetical protein
MPGYFGGVGWVDMNFNVFNFVLIIEYMIGVQNISEMFLFACAV